MSPQFLLLALGTLASEDLTCISAGVLIAQGRIGFVEGTLACLLGIVGGDILLFLAGRCIGRPALSHPFVSRFLSPEKIEEASTWLSAKGLHAVIISRFTPGLRLATYFAAGSLRTRFWSFAAYFLLASIIWTPLLVGSTVLFGDQLLRSVFTGSSGSSTAFAASSAVLTFGFLFSRRLFAYSRRRELIGMWKRWAKWEFWPPWLAYLPLLPYLLYLALRHRSLTVFTAANPGIPTGGFVGESKSQILNRLRDSQAVARFEVIPAELGSAAKLAYAADLMAQLDFHFPIVLKPDVGERGAGVAVIRSSEEMQHYFSAAQGPVILQQYVEGAEFGVFYCRYPHERHGRIFSITEKRFPEVVGDGRRTFGELILNDSRAVCMASTYAKSSKRPLKEVPALGQRIKLVELGSHCRGAIFLDGQQWNSPELEAAIDRVSHVHTGFYFGRFDVRTPSSAALQQGIFRVIELNGVSAEATHIYDPAVSLPEAYRVLFQQWRIAFEIGAANRQKGIQPSSLSELMTAVLQRFGLALGCRHQCGNPRQTRKLIAVDDQNSQ
jgi:membrane protein DedA with SNARE-associated domain